MEQGARAALRSAVEQARDHFHRCARCANHYCDSCWNEDEGVCTVCVPRLDAEISAINREAKLSRAREVAFAQAVVSEDDLKTRVITCRDCGAAVGRGKFCPECGKPTSLTRACGSCQAEIPSSAKFCPECGAQG
jgi:membrane protease subunit (stomatin/prohibitin family)